MLYRLMLLAISTVIYSTAFAPMPKTARRGGDCKAKAVAEVPRALTGPDIRSEGVILTLHTCFLAGL
jgi:hypothetical protein